jgi:hypothetical protein
MCPLLAINKVYVVDSKEYPYTCSCKNPTFCFNPFSLFAYGLAYYNILL